MRSIVVGSVLVFRTVRFKNREQWSVLVRVSVNQQNLLVYIRVEEPRTVKLRSYS